MQRFAHWTNLSETTFVLPPTAPGAPTTGCGSSPPTSELPFAGHPTLGTCHAWLENGGAPKEPETCRAGVRRRAGDVAQDGPRGWRSPRPRCCGRGRWTSLLVERIAGMAGASAATRSSTPSGPTTGPAGWRCCCEEGGRSARAAPRAPIDIDLGVVGPYPQGSPLGDRAAGVLPGHQRQYGRGSGDGQPERLGRPVAAAHRPRPPPLRKPARAPCWAAPDASTSPPAGAPRAVRGRWSGWAAPASRVSSARSSCEPYAVTRPELCGDRQVRRPHHADHRVATGRRMVGEEDDRLARSGGTWTAPVTMPSLGSCPACLASGRGPCRPYALRGCCPWLTSYGSAQSSAERLRREPVVARAPGTIRSSGGRRLPGGCQIHRDLHQAPRAAHREHGPLAQRRRAEPGQRIRGTAAEHRLDSVIPPRTARYVRNPHTGAPNRSSPPAGTQNMGHPSQPPKVGLRPASTGTGESPDPAWVGEGPDPAWREAPAALGEGPGPTVVDEGPVSGQGAPVTATQAPARNASRAPPYVSSIAAAPSGLPTSRLASRRLARSAAPERGTPSGASRGGRGPGRSRGAGGEDFDHAGLEAYARPRPEQRRRLGVDVPDRDAVRPSSCHPPGDSAGRSRRSDRRSPPNRPARTSAASPAAPAAARIEPVR